MNGWWLSGRIDERRCCQPERTPSTRRAQPLPLAHRVHVDGLEGDEIRSARRRPSRHDAIDGTPGSTGRAGSRQPFFTGELVAAHISGDAIPIVLCDLISTEIADLDDT